jgi:tetratricopeptide (TPR) repeat protein
VVSIIAVLLSFVGGFLLANALNKRELDQLRSENARLQSENRKLTISDEEIQAKLAEADRRTDDFNFQKSLGIALYRYSIISQESKYLPDVFRLLERANSSNPDDFETLIALADVSFDLGQVKKDNLYYEKARKFYQEALKLRPKDADIQNSIGVTYLLSEPPNYEKAITEFQKALKINPNHEKSLENLIRAYTTQGRNEEAEEAKNKLKQINPENQILKELDKPR